MEASHRDLEEAIVINPQTNKPSFPTQELQRSTPQRQFLLLPLKDRGCLHQNTPTHYKYIIMEATPNLEIVNQPSPMQEEVKFEVH